MYQNIIDSTKKKMEESLDYLEKELAKIRVGKATTALVSEILINYYNTKVPLKQLANITTPEPQMIIIEPFDKNSLEIIQKSIQQSNLNLNPSIEGSIIRIIVPPLTEERRKEIKTILSQKIEEIKGSLRNIREEGWQEIKKLESSGQITEDDKYKAKDELDNLIKEYNGKVEDLRKIKEKEVMRV